MAALSGDSVLSLASSELTREMATLGTQPVPPYYMSYNIGDEENVQMTASYGAITRSDSTRHRMLLVDLRVGDYGLDNTHQLRSTGDAFARNGAKLIPYENNAFALRAAIWRETDQSYKSAVERLAEVRTNKAVKVAEEDSSGDFSKAVEVV